MDDAILAATVALISDGGYSAVSIEGVAALAGVSRNAVYRRWSSKAELVFDAVFPAGSEFRFPDTGTLAGDLRDVLLLFARDFRRPEAKAAVGGLIADAQTNGSLLVRFRDRLEHLAGTAFKELLERAVRRGELAGGAPPDATLHLLIGAALYRVLVVDGAPEPLADVLEDLISPRRL